ncbi:MAG: peptidoglycan recognition family protein [Bacillota bacterium]|nr:peptidoglycan recognition family protein [Bacillota bacterium]
MKKDNSFLMALLAAVLLTVIVILIVEARDYRRNLEAVPDYVDVALIALDGEARSGLPLNEVRNIVIHYTGNPGAAAGKIRDYCNERDAHAAPHFIIGLEGEIIQCIPLNEKASASNERNGDSLSIEVCHRDESGEFTKESYAALVKLTAWLCGKYGLTENSVIRHYDITGKECPLCFVENENAWQEFKADVRENIQ